MHTLQFNRSYWIFLRKKKKKGAIYPPIRAWVLSPEREQRKKHIAWLEMKEWAAIKKFIYLFTLKQYFWAFRCNFQNYGRWKATFKWSRNRKCWPVGSVRGGFPGVWFSVTFSDTGSDGVFETAGCFLRGVFWQWISYKKQMNMLFLKTIDFFSFYVLLNETITSH